jgi:hypothetical protein
MPKIPSRRAAANSLGVLGALVALVSVWVVSLKRRKP